MFWKRKLYQDSMNAGIGIEGGDTSKQLGLIEFGRIALKNRMKANILTGFHLIADIDLTSRIITDHNDR